jgi:hypothetical protein
MHPNLEHLSWPNLLLWGSLIVVLHLTLLIAFRIFDFVPQLSRKKCRGSDLIAYELVGTLCVIYVTIAGFVGYFDINGMMDNKTIWDNKFYGYSTFIQDYLVIPMLCYQTWNLICCIIHNEFRNAPMIGHHVVTGMLAYFGLFPYAQYYALFYFGIAEITSIPLSAINIFKYLPHLSEKYPLLYNISKNSFAIGFFIVRIFIWPCVSYDLWFGCQDLLKTNKAHSRFVVNYFLFSNLFLTFLQFYWGYLILRKALGGGGKEKAKENKKK